MGMKRPTDAAASYSAAVVTLPNWAQPYRAQSVAYAAAGDADRAIGALKAGLEATSRSPQLAMDLALLYERLGRVDDAAATYDAMLDRNPHDDGAANNLAMLLATYRTDAHSLERALRLAERFATSEQPVLLDTYGWVLFKAGRTSEALPVLERAVAKAPRAGELRYHLGMIQMKAGKKDEARSNLQAAVTSGADFRGIDEARATLGTL
jgi:Flp pilus assembly protein TadD